MRPVPTAWAEWPTGTPARAAPAAPACSKPRRLGVQRELVTTPSPVWVARRCAATSCCLANDELALEAALLLALDRPLVVARPHRHEEDLHFLILVDLDGVDAEGEHLVVAERDVLEVRVAPQVDGPDLQ